MDSEAELGMENGETKGIQRTREQEGVISRWDIKREETWAFWMWMDNHSHSFPTLMNSEAELRVEKLREPQNEREDNLGSVEICRGKEKNTFLTWLGSHTCELSHGNQFRSRDRGAKRGETKRGPNSWNIEGTFSSWDIPAKAPWTPIVNEPLHSPRHGK